MWGWMGRKFTGLNYPGAWKSPTMKLDGSDGKRASVSTPRMNSPAKPAPTPEHHPSYDVNGMGTRAGTGEEETWHRHQDSVS